MKGNQKGVNCLYSAGYGSCRVSLVVEIRSDVRKL